MTTRETRIEKNAYFVRQIEFKIWRFAKVSDRCLNLGDPAVYVMERIDDLLSAIASASGKISDDVDKDTGIFFTVVCSKAVGSKLNQLQKTDPSAAQLVRQININDLICKYGTFYLKFHGRVLEDRPIRRPAASAIPESSKLLWDVPGIAYDTPITRSEYEIRWQLQQNDGYYPEKAYEHAKKLSI